MLVLAASVVAFSGVAVTHSGAATNGSNQSTVRVPAEPIRSVTVSPVTQTAFICPTGIVPRGACYVGERTGRGIAGGVTVTNGAAPSVIEVTGHQAVPSTGNGTPWNLTDRPTTGPDQFVELTEGTGPWATQLAIAARCDNSFDDGRTPCLATPGESRQESLQIIGPSRSSTSGLFTITTTWTALPPG